MLGRTKVGFRNRFEHLTFWNREISLRDNMKPKVEEELLKGGFQEVIGVQITVDHRDSSADPKDGWFVKAFVEGTDNSLGSIDGYLSTSVDVRQFFKLPEADHTLGYHLLGKYGVSLPFYEKYRIDGKWLRGFPGGRYTGNIEMGGGLEYRYYIGPLTLEYSVLDYKVRHRIGIALFVEAGRIWDEEVGVRFPEDLAYDGGLGLRMGLDFPNPVTVLRADFGFSRESVKVSPFFKLTLDYVNPF